MEQSLFESKSTFNEKSLSNTPPPPYPHQKTTADCDIKSMSQLHAFTCANYFVKRIQDIDITRWSDTNQYTDSQLSKKKNNNPCYKKKKK